MTGRNLDSKFQWAWLCRPCTGAILRVIEQIGSKLKIEAIDLYKLPPPVDDLGIWQYYYGTQVHIDGKVTRYPDVKNAFEIHGYEPAGTAMPLVAPVDTSTLTVTHVWSYSLVKSGSRTYKVYKR